MSAMEVGEVDGTSCDLFIDGYCTYVATKEAGCCGKENCQRFDGETMLDEVERLKRENADLKHYIDSGASDGELALELRREVMELRAMVKELCDAAHPVVVNLYTTDDGQSVMRDVNDLLNLSLAISKTPAQSLEDYGMRVAEAVQSECAKRSFDAEITYRIHNIDLAPIVKEVE